jgi:hypothetical protein
MSLQSHLAAVVGSLSLALFGVAGSAHAAHLVKVDAQSVTQGPAEPSQLPGQSLPCVQNSEAIGQGFLLTPTVALVDVGSFVSLAGDCMASRTFINTATLTVTLVADPEDGGGPATLCFAGSHSLAAESTGDGTSSASFGGSSGPPFVTPATITRSPGAITIFSDGPIAVLTGTNADSRSGLFSANIGDMITLDVGEETVADLMGTGSASARGEARLSIGIGSCIDHGAPAVSHAGLMLLAALLGIFGAVSLARRRFSGARA